MNRSILIAAATLAAAASPALAQIDPMAMARTASANQLGVMEYCQSHGWTDQAAVEAQRKSSASLPPASTGTDALAAAEATGKQGFFLNNGTQMSLAQMSSGRGTNEQGLCTQLGEAIKSVAARLTATPGIPAAGMPSAGNLTSIPGLPPGMTNGTGNMTGVPGLPAGMPAMPKP